MFFWNKEIWQIEERMKGGAAWTNTKFTCIKSNVKTIIIPEKDQTSSLSFLQSQHFKPPEPNRNNICVVPPESTVFFYIVAKHEPADPLWTQSPIFPGPLTRA